MENVPLTLYRSEDSEYREISLVKWTSYQQPQRPFASQRRSCSHFGLRPSLCTDPNGEPDKLIYAIAILQINTRYVNVNTNE